MGAGRRAGIDGINIQSTGTSGFDITFSGSRNTYYTHNFYRYDNSGNLVRSGSQTSSNRDIKLVGRVFDLGTNGSVSLDFKRWSIWKTRSLCVLGDGTTKLLILILGPWIWWIRYKSLECS